MNIIVHDAGLTDTTGYVSPFVTKAQKPFDSPDVNPLHTNATPLRNSQSLKLTVRFPMTHEEIQILPINNNCEKYWTLRPIQV